MRVKSSARVAATEALSATTQRVGSGGRMPAAMRKSRIVEAVRRAGFISVVDIAAELAVADMTIRRDLVELEREGRLTRPMVARLLRRARVGI